jgi:7-cyano-7-deazaguanine synthase
MTSRRSAVVLLSGGIDSAVVLGLLRGEGWPAEALFVNFGQRALAPERVASRAIAAWYEVGWEEVQVGPLCAAPFGEVPGRNDLFLAIASAARPTSHIAIGVHAGTDYIDCSTPHLEAWQALFDLEFGGSRRVLAPLIQFSKGAILSTASAMSLPLELTWSCEADGGPCGVCASCRDRAAYVGA